ncbi:cupin domain-containing protein [Deinococcus sp. QL22]|uniref:cupin domain-containing protein n=1 Tax=Deinococcus sp. QL22 TaxID=2939437 RepID=UPI002017793A|nr:cupin domain-containing protein [Deinococcus sp. QL22]UQN09479.1 cupin domain-containing protein [Deinococcus sp. QL22]
MNRAEPPQILCATPHGRVLLFTLQTGQGLPSHRHPQHWGIITVLSGTLAATFGGMQTLSRSEVFRFDANEPIELRAATDDTCFLVTLIPMTPPETLP